ncbi:MAG TPA: SRPBCC domain-containing protein [Polyangiaceae bacterium]
MSAESGDQARVSVLVGVPPSVAFRVFTEEIDVWWRTGLKYRLGGKRRSVIRLEPGVGGRLFESVETQTQAGRRPRRVTQSGTRVFDTGRVTAWEPPSRLVFEWRAVNFAPSEKTEVEVVFEPSPSGTLVTVTHRGWSRIRPDHPARHGHEVSGFLRTLGLWWGGLMSSLREHAEPS